MKVSKNVFTKLSILSYLISLILPCFQNSSYSFNLFEWLWVLLLWWVGFFPNILWVTSFFLTLPWICNILYLISFDSKKPIRWVVLNTINLAIWSIPYFFWYYTDMWAKWWLSEMSVDIWYYFRLSSFVLLLLHFIQLELNNSKLKKVTT
jgi:hypothetical protein